MHKTLCPLIHRLFLMLVCIGMCHSVLLPHSDAHANASMRDMIIIRDTEIETILKEWITPLAQAAGLDPDNVRLILVQNPDINAFVAGGPNIFLYTGIFDRAEHAGEVMGVLAHELGHISGGHLIAMRGAFEHASYEMILGTLLGIGAAIISGESGAAATISGGTRTMAEGRFLASSRVHEHNADLAALDYFRRAGLNPSGLVSFMARLADEELLPPHLQSAYMRTHPLTRDRLAALQAGWEQSPYKNDPLPHTWQDQHQRIRAKLSGFLYPEQITQRYPLHDTSIHATYARALASYVQGDQTKALEGMDALLKQEPDNPYFIEMKGQILRDFGHLSKARTYYTHAITLRPNAPLLRTALAHIILEDNPSKQDLRDSILYLQEVIRTEQHEARPHRLMAIAYGRLGDETRARLHLAEEALLNGAYPLAIRQANTALQTLPPETPEHLRAKDILHFAEKAEKDRRRR